MRLSPSLAAALALVLLLAASPAPASPAPESEKPPGPIAQLVAMARGQLPALGFERRSADVAGHGLVWWQKGEGAPVVMIHGVADQAATWLLVAPSIGEGRQLFLVDLPGHGDSGPAAGPLPMGAVVAGLEGWLKGHVGAADRPVTLVGNSMGAWLAAIIAHRHPEWVERAVLINGGPIASRPVPDGAGGVVSLMPADRDEARALMAAIRDPGFPATPDAVLDDLVARVTGGEVERMFAAEADLERHLLTGRLAEITTPVTVIWGTSDRFLGDDFKTRLLGGLPRAELLEVPACGHMPQIECAAALIPHLRTALAPRSQHSEP
ncbi:MAG: alpha/beta fold hydrolase [Acidobacteriota bacterium]